MAIIEIPKSYNHVCDGCGHSQNKTSNNRPMYWADIIIQEDAYDFQGAAVADGSTQLLFCNDCKYKLIELINKNFKKSK